MNLLNKIGIDKEQIVVLSMAGSHMYGTTTKNSDTDYLGIYLPTKRDLLLNRVEKQIPFKENGIDLQLWSIHYFFKLACQGETMAIDLLHSPVDCWVCFNESVWNYLQKNKNLFYTRNMKSYVSYARKQAAKYGTKGNRIKTLEEVIGFLKSLPLTMRLREVWNELPAPDHVYFIEEEPYNMYQVNGKKFQETVSIEYILKGLKQELHGYGERARLAAENQGIDWKAVSHAIRAANQVYDILKHGSYQYPLANAEFITQVKLGQISQEVTENTLDYLLSEIDIMSETSKLPDKVDSEFWDDWLCRFMKIYVRN